DALRAKSIALTSFLLELAAAELPELGVATPRAEAERGGHVAFTHPDAWRICCALKAAGVIPDFRPPDIIRLAPAPLYTSFADSAGALARLKNTLRDKTHEKFPARHALVT